MTLDFVSNPWLYLVLGLVLGLGVGYLAYRIYRLGLRRNAELHAQEIVDQAKDGAEIQALELKERYQEIEEEIWEKVEKSFHQTEDRIEELEHLADERKQKLDRWVHQAKSRMGQIEREVNIYQQKVKDLEGRLASRRGRNDKILDEITQRLSEKLQVKPEDVVADLARQMIEEAERERAQTVDRSEADAQEHYELYAKEILDRAISRFHRPYCPERGIPPVYFQNADQRRILCDPAGENLKTIAECTGCDVVVADDMDLIGIAGFDPVRRELTRRVLERCLKERKPIKPEFIRRTTENIKRELISLIKKDGDLLARELRLEGLHPEIRQMMGSLRYRYSFTQNQYFHCGEVGWLCGLLAAELGGVDRKKARRAGMLHDLGKSMDHELEGGHAVIGANFIQARNEAPDIVHAVRAHHFDETPSTDLAYLVIAADAISGARPGARRSTIESYNQKVSELEAIAKSFQGVTDCIILNGGRECRVIVNSRQVDDFKALEMSRQIAHRIQEECNYPGQIKVVVVRETVATDVTRAGI